METTDKNCKNCIRFSTCKFVEENRNFAKTNKMFSMFEYLESNNLEDIFYKNAIRCKFYIRDTINADVVSKQIRDALYGFSWLKNYINSFTVERLEKYKENAAKAADNYFDALKKYDNDPKTD